MNESLSSIIPLVLIFMVFYFVLLRPQQKRLKDHQNMVKSLRRGDVVVTSGGIIAKIVKAKDDQDEIEVEIADGVRVRFVRSMIADMRSKSDSSAGGD